MGDGDCAAPRLAAGMHPLGCGALRRHAVQAELHVLQVVDRHPPEQRLLPADVGIGRQRREIEHVGHAELLDAAGAVGAGEAVGDAPARLLDVERAAEADALEHRRVVGMHEADMAHVERVLDVLEVVAIATVGVDLDHAVEMLELGIARELRRRAFAQEREDEAEVFAHRIGRDRDLVAEAVLLGRLLEAAVIEAAQRITLDPAGRKLGAAVGAAGIDQVRAARLAAIERELLAHDADGDGAALGEVDRVIDRLPELAQVPAGRRAGAGMDAVHAARGLPDDRDGLCHRSASYLSSTRPTFSSA